MTISVDDLVASLSSNHIGQEALDLADLQAQLSQTLLCQSSQQFYDKGTAPCTTPTARSHIILSHRQRSSSVASTSSWMGAMDRENDIAEEAMETEEEYAVEELLGSAPSRTPIYTSQQHTDHVTVRQMSSTMSHHHAASYQQYDAYPPSGIESSSPIHSSFASTDPFYAAVLASQTQAQAHSFFTQAGYPAPQSPFTMHSQQKQMRPMPFTLPVDRLPMYVATAGFDG